MFGARLWKKKKKKQKKGKNPKIFLHSLYKFLFLRFHKADVKLWMEGCSGVKINENHL